MIFYKFFVFFGNEMDRLSKKTDFAGDAYFFILSIDIFFQKEYNFIICVKDDKEGKKVKYHRNVYRCLALITQFGISMLTPIFLCSFLGIYLDRKLGTQFFMILLFFMGAAAGFRNIWRMAKSIYEEKSEKDSYEEKNK